jgi:hypothetical protein
VMTDDGPQLPFAPGECLYHYTSMETLLRYILPKGTIKLSPYASVRDPLEVKKHIEIGPPSPLEIRARVKATDIAGWVHDWDPGRDDPNMDPRGLIEFRIGQVQKSLARIAAELAAYVPIVWQTTYAKHVKMLCLTQDAPFAREEERPYSFGYARPRMWEQYGDNHRGVCLCFGRDELLATLEEEASGRRGFSWAWANPSGAYDHGPVTYRRTGPDQRVLTAPLASVSASLELASPDDAYEFLVANRKALWGELLFAKLDDWEGEREYRWVTFRRDDTAPCFTGYRAALKAVIIGEEFPQWAVASLREINTSRRVYDGELLPPAALYRLQWPRQTPTLWPPLPWHAPDD